MIPGNRPGVRVMSGATVLSISAVFSRAPRVFICYDVFL